MLKKHFPLCSMEASGPNVCVGCRIPKWTPRWIPPEVHHPCSSSFRYPAICRVPSNPVVPKWLFREAASAWDEVGSGWQGTSHAVGYNCFLTGDVRIGGQSHFYMETNCAFVIPRKEDKEMDVYVSTQDASSVQVRGNPHLGRLSQEDLGIFFLI